MGCGNKTACLQSVTMEQIIDPVSVDLIKAELTPEKKLCDTNKGGNVAEQFTYNEDVRHRNQR